MKIGVMTFHAARNYGAVLQAYALQSYLKKIGHDPFCINYRFQWNQSPFNLRTWLSRTPRGMALKLNDNILRYVFYRFRRRHLVVRPRHSLGYQELSNAPLEADAYICGSDQIWNPNAIHAIDEPAVWLGFGCDRVRRIAYAASFSVPDLDGSVCDRWAVYARRFNAVGVREKDGVQLMKKLGRNDAVWVPDPTLLLDASEYDAVEFKPEKRCAPFYFKYILGADNDLLASSVAQTLRHCLGWAPYVLRPHLLGFNLFRSGFIGPGEWLGNLHRSAFVLTNSFHGVVFSLIFHRPFIALLRAQKDAAMNSRVTSLLDAVGLHNRALASYDGAKVEKLCREEIDWDRVDTRRKLFREKGCQFIREALA